MRMRNVWPVCVLIVAGMATFAVAAKPAAKSAQPAADTSAARAARLVTAALEAEASGLIERRDALLREALDADPDCAAARWHRGEVRSGDRWLSVDEAARETAAAGKIFDYNNRRLAAGRTAEGQLALARWCRQAGLVEQHRAHAIMAMAADPQSEAARAELGMQNYNGLWLTPDEFAETQQRLQREEAAFKQYRKQLARWQKGLNSRRSEVRSAAEQELCAVSDPAIIGAIERTLSIDTRETALAAVAAIAQFEGRRACESLVAHAVLSPWEEVRQAAAEALRPRSIYSYAPLLLSGLQAPVEAEFAFVQEGFGSWRYTCMLFREGPLADEAADLQVRIRPNHRPRLDRNSDPSADSLVIVPEDERGLEASQQLAQEQFGVNDETIDELNRRARELNARIAYVLKVAAEAAADADKSDSMADPNHPRRWWNWWCDLNDIYYTNERPIVDSFYQYQASYEPIVYSQRLEATAVVGTGGPSSRRSGVASLASGANVAECFAADTPVYSPAGAMRIDQVQPGDLVLAQDPETGELAYKGVLATTIRPATPLTRIVLADGELAATPGHPLWVSGKGWRMVRELETGDLLRTVSGPQPILRIEASAKEPAYNLIVEGFNTYFAGPAKVLAHDNNLRQPTDCTVPGLLSQRQ